MAVRARRVFVCPGLCSPGRNAVLAARKGRQCRPRTRAHAHRHAHAHTRARAHADTHMHMYAHARAHTCAHTCARACTHARAGTHAHMPAHTYTRTHVRAGTHTRAHAQTPTTTLRCIAQRSSRTADGPGRRVRVAPLLSRPWTASASWNGNLHLCLRLFKKWDLEFVSAEDVMEILRPTK